MDRCSIAYHFQPLAEVSKLGGNGLSIAYDSFSSRPLDMDIHLQSFTIPHYPSLMIAMSKPEYLAIMEYTPTRPAIVFIPSRHQCHLTIDNLLLHCTSDNNPDWFLNIDKADLQLHPPRHSLPQVGKIPFTATSQLHGSSPIPSPAPRVPSSAVKLPISWCVPCMEQGSFLCEVHCPRPVTVTQGTFSNRLGIIGSLTICICSHQRSPAATPTPTSHGQSLYTGRAGSSCGRSIR